MPQMSPCLWLLFSFIMMCIMLFIMAFFYFTDISLSDKAKIDTLRYNMKWTW